MDAQTLTEAACRILRTAAPEAKAELTARLAEAWRANRIAEIGDAAPPCRPSRPPRPVLLPPGKMPRRRIKANPAGRIAQLHALAHIELNAIDLAWDIVARFAPGTGAPRDFCNDWVRVAAEEAKHFTLLTDRLAALGARYGDLPAHGGLWETAEKSAHALTARLALVPLVLEARGLDVTPAMMEKFRAAGDHASADVLEIIHADEIGHVAIGKRWFDRCCHSRGVDPIAAFHDLVRQHYKSALKPPFNHASRMNAGLTAAYYEPLAERRSGSIV
jgi:uncharacterized ferritin-like protein (DUF455 family)